MHLVLAVVIGLSGCTQFENAMASIPVFAYLRNAPFFDPYEAPRPAPPNSVPFASPAGNTYGAITNTEAGLNAFAAGKTNPLPTDTTTLAFGKRVYDRHCMVCHGVAGRGDGPILNKPGETGKFPFAPNLTLPITVGRSDGYLYGIIAAGRGLMPSYGPRMSHLERWATVSYLRQLQRASAAPAAAGQTQAAEPRR